MKKKLLTVLAVVAIMAACKKAEDKAIDTTPSTADTTAVIETAAPAMDSAAVAQAWEKYMTPGEAHKFLAMDSGNWDVEMTFWQAPGQPATKANVTASGKMILGGRYQQTTFSGSMMGMPFEGISTVGHDNATGKMVSTWMDNMGTGIMYMNGVYDQGSNQVEFKGEVTDPVTGKNKPSREIYTIVDNNTRKMEMFDIGADGKEFKNMEILMKRK